MTREVIIQGSHSGVIKVKAGETLSVINLEGSQVADLWAFTDHPSDEFLSAEHTRSCLNKLVPKLGDSVYSNLRHPLLFDETPSPFNIFQRVDIDNAGELSINPPHVKAGDFIRFRAERDLTVIVSACPMDIAMTNGPDGKTRPIKLEANAN